ncbi:MAG: hypothetical protein ACK55Z_25940, partial [bacterium]
MEGSGRKGRDALGPKVWRPKVVSTEVFSHLFSCADAHPAPTSSPESSPPGSSPPGRHGAGEPLRGGWLVARAPPT